MTISIAGTLILNGDIQALGEVRVEYGGLLIPVPRDLMDSVYSCPAKDIVNQNGKTPTISTQSDIQILGTVDGVGQGFPPNFGPGANSTLKESQNDPSDLFGANHAGIGAVYGVPGTIEYVEEEHVVNNLDMYHGGIDLKYLPIPGTVTVNINGGTSQREGEDFQMLGDVLSWAGLGGDPLIGLDLIIAVGDIVRIIYMADTARIFPGPRSTYGSYEAPTSVGSGSGEVGGGSGLKLVARNGFINFGGFSTINISGQNGTSNRSGGGAGGSLWAQAYDLKGSGSIICDGGDASYAYAGGGGGGYVTLNYEHDNLFQGPISVAGHKGGTHGITTIKKIEPFFIEKFTGNILNTKWWEITADPVVIQNVARMDTTTGDFRNPRLESLFRVSGTSIQVDCDFVPEGMEPSYHTSYFRLEYDDRNWVAVARKHNHIFGMYTVDGFLSQSAIPYDYTNTTFRILKTDSTFSMQFVDSSAGPTTILTESIPDLNYVNFKVAMGVQKDEPDSSNYISDYFRLTNVDEANGYVTLSGIPVDSSDVSLNVIGGAPQLYGTDFTVSGQDLYWIPSNLNLQENDDIVASYANDTTFNNLVLAWDNFKVFTGILSGIETAESTLYVDPAHGSDSSDGRVLSPLQNLFVATAWSKKGGTVVLYDGTYNPAEVLNKELTILGSYGSNATITTANVQDSTGSNWEYSGLTFRDCQGLVKNIKFIQAREAILAQNTHDIEITDCVFQDISTAVSFTDYNKNCRIIANTVKDSSVGFIFDSQSYNPLVYSNVVYDSSVAVVLIDASNYQISSNTFDEMDTGILVITDNCSTGFVASNNITNSNVGLYLNADTSTGVFNNNFYGTGTIILGSGTITNYSNNIKTNPAYVSQVLRNYHLLSFSTDRSTGTDLLDPYYRDRDGVRRASTPGYDIGAYQYINATHIPGAYYVDTSGEDNLNSGNIYSPYRTLDKAMYVADSSVYMSNVDSSGLVGGHFDSYFLNLKEQNIYFVDASKQTQTYTLDSYYSNINLGSVLYVSSSGSDATVLGGDGTDSGGDGSIQRPFRTIARALEVSSVGTYIISLSGEYPLFNGRVGRIIVPTGDRTGIPDGRMYIEDLFYAQTVDFPGHNPVLDETSWTFSIGNP